MQLERLRTPEEEELEQKRAELAALEAKLVQQELELATLLAELHAFQALYLRAVGVRYAKLDELKAQIAEALARLLPADFRAQQEAEYARTKARESQQTVQDAPHPPPNPLRPPMISKASTGKSRSGCTPIWHSTGASAKNGST